MIPLENKKHDFIHCGLLSPEELSSIGKNGRFWTKGGSFWGWLKVKNLNMLGVSELGRKLKKLTLALICCRW